MLSKNPTEIELITKSLSTALESFVFSVVLLPIEGTKLQIEYGSSHSLQNTTVLEQFQTMMELGTEKGFSFTGLFIHATQNDKALLFENKKDAEYKSNGNLSVLNIAGKDPYFVARHLLTELGIKRELLTNSDGTLRSEVLTNLENVLFKPTTTLDMDTVLLCPVFSGNRYVGLLNLTFQSEPELDVESLVGIPLGLAKALLTSSLILRLKSFTTRVARTAIVSRNFSHITGSHVISNPEFAMHLVANGREKLLESFENVKKIFTDSRAVEFEHAENDGPTRVGSRWDPWNAVSGLLDDKIKELKDRVDLTAINRFHNYLQARFDFIAGAIEETNDQPEPVFFVSELLNGFLEQEEFLDTLVADLGVRLADMKFEVSFEFSGGDPVRFWRKYSQIDNGNSWEPDPQNKRSGDQIENYDFMVGLPGGLIASQAFYSLLENVMRNSIKYQFQEITKDEPYTLSIAIKDADQRKAEQKQKERKEQIDPTRFEGRFLVEINDSWSKNEYGAKAVSKILGEPLVSSQGEPAKTGLGVQEMKLCAESLVSADFQTTLNRTEVTNGAVTATGMPADPHQDLFLGKGEVAAPLTFLLELEQPVLLGLVTEAFERADKGIICVAQDMKAFQGKSAHILVVDAAKQNDLVVFLNENNETHHRMLPCRVLVLGDENAELDSQLTEWVERRRRIHFLKCDTAYEGLFKSHGADPATPEATATDDEDQNRKQKKKDQQDVLTAYDAWLRAYKGQSGNAEPWLLCIGFEREFKQVQNAWNGVIDKFNAKSRIIKIAVRSKLRDVKAQIVGGSHSDPRLDDSLKLESLDVSLRQRLLVFDNHGRCFGNNWSLGSENEWDYRKSLRYYQRFSGGTPDLYRLLSHPPKSAFAFSFFIHSLVESCLTNVLIVDERLAGNLLFGDADRTNNQFNNDLAAHQKAGVFPIFTMKHSPSRTDFIASENTETNDNNSDREGHYTPEHKSTFEKIVACDEIRDREGIAYTSSGNQNCFGDNCRCSAAVKLLIVDSNGNFELDESLKFDVLVIHEGALDILKGKGGINWLKDQDHCLYEMAPILVRTSGRGRRTVNLNPTVPFIEFHIVSSAVLTSRNKYGLVRGLYGATGQDLGG